MDIEGKIVLLTGASQGIGAACAAVLRREGAKLCLTARSSEKLRAVSASEDLVVPADLLETGAPESLVRAAIDRFGRIDVLINNAGAGLYMPAHSAPPETAARLFQLDLLAPLELIRQTVPFMKKQGAGCIVNVSSVAGALALPWFTLYSAAKSALITMTDGLRMELRPSGIHCISVLPGYVRTNFQYNILGGNVPPALGSMKQRWSISPEQCAEAIVRGIRSDARTVVTPGSGRILIALSRLFPRMVDRTLMSMLARAGSSDEVRA